MLYWLPHILWLTLCVWIALHDSEAENDALHHALVDSTLQRLALEEARRVEWTRVRADRALLRACRDKLALRDAEHDSDIVMSAIRGAEYYNTTTHQYAHAAGVGE